MRLAAYLSAATLLFSATFNSSSAHADLIGSTVAGSLVYTGSSLNAFDTANGVVPTAGYGNSSGSTSIIVGSGVEFGVSNGILTYTYNFSDTSLHVTNAAAILSPENSYSAAFTDPAFTSLTVLGNTMVGLSAGLSGDMLTLNFAGHFAPNYVIGDLGTADFLLAPPLASPVPEESTFILLGIGIVGLTNVAWFGRQPKKRIQCMPPPLQQQDISHTTPPRRRYEHPERGRLSCGLEG
jgi:hypothetical protein